MPEPHSHLAGHVVCPRLLLPDVDQLLGQHGGGLLVAHLGGLLDLGLKLLLLPLKLPPVPLDIAGHLPQGLVVFSHLLWKSKQVAIISLSQEVHTLYSWFLPEEIHLSGRVLLLIYHKY